MKPRRPSAPLPRADVCAVLLSGFAAQALDGSKPHGFSGGFLDLFTDEGTAHLWQTHEAHLRALAKRHGIAPEWEGDNGAPLFYAEFIADQLNKGMNE